MKLRDFIAGQGVTVAEWARRHDRRRATVNRHVNGVRIPAPDEMKFYFEVSGGAVTPDDFYDLAPQTAVTAAGGRL